MFGKTARIEESAEVETLSGGSKQTLKITSVPEYVLGGEKLTLSIKECPSYFESEEGEVKVTIEPSKGLKLIKRSGADYVFYAGASGCYNVHFETKWRKNDIKIEVFPEPEYIDASVDGRSHVKLYQSPKVVAVRVEPYCEYNQAYTWKSSDPDVCQIDWNNIIHPIGIGRCKLTCYSMCNGVQTELIVNVLPDIKNNKNYFNRYSILQLFMMIVGIVACMVNKYNEYTSLVTEYGAFSPPFIRWLPIMSLLLVILLGILSILRNKKTIILSIVYFVVLMLVTIWCGTFSAL